MQYLITQKNLCAGRRVGAARGGQRGRGRGRRGGRGWGGRERGRGRGRDSARGRQARAITAHALAADSSDDEKDVAAAVAADEEQGEEEDEKEEEEKDAGELLGHELDSSGSEVDTEADPEYLLALSRSLEPGSQYRDRAARLRAREDKQALEAPRKRPCGQL